MNRAMRNLARFMLIQSFEERIPVMIIVNLSDPGLESKSCEFETLEGARSTLNDSRYTEAFVTLDGTPVERWSRQPGDAWTYTSIRRVMVQGDKVTALTPDGKSAFLGRIEEFDGDSVLIRQGEPGMPGSRVDLWPRAQVIRH